MCIATQDARHLFLLASLSGKMKTLTLEVKKYFTLFLEVCQAVSKNLSFVRSGSPFSGEPLTLRMWDI